MQNVIFVLNKPIIGTMFEFIETVNVTIKTYSDETTQ